MNHHDEWSTNSAKLIPESYCANNRHKMSIKDEFLCTERELSDPFNRPAWATLFPSLKFRCDVPPAASSKINFFHCCICYRQSQLENEDERGREKSWESAINLFLLQIFHEKLFFRNWILLRSGWGEFKYLFKQAAAGEVKSWIYINEKFHFRTVHTDGAYGSMNIDMSLDYLLWFKSGETARKPLRKQLINFNTQTVIHCCNESSVRIMYSACNMSIE